MLFIPTTVYSVSPRSSRDPTYVIAILKCIASHRNTAIGTNNLGEIWRWSDGTWVQLQGNLTQVEVGCEGYHEVWGTNGQGQVWFFRSSSRHECLLEHKRQQELQQHSSHHYTFVDVTCHPHVPSHTVAGHQHNSGTVYAAIAHTPHGRIPGKALNGTCWYPYGGGECVTNSFSWVTSCDYHLVQNPGYNPSSAIPGHQNDCGCVYVAIATTQWGNIPGKAKDGLCWFSYDGLEHTTRSFQYVCHH
eukprot:TRINITY_DN5984_c0_g1_i5.p2 TRINITY_DN5984_c0_g1~~TRINITY_DN5984_c0_g1_i5.p2  ORF type:complete len:246 (-),score=39.80 TRINITY_DN5984_c0_g1_i5:232-969(-)